MLRIAVICGLMAASPIAAGSRIPAKSGLPMIRGMSAFAAAPSIKILGYGGAAIARYMLTVMSGDGIAMPLCVHLRNLCSFAFSSFMHFKYRVY